MAGSAGLADNAARAKKQLINEVQRGDMARAGTAVSPDLRKTGDANMFKGAQVAIQKGIISSPSDLDPLREHLSEQQITELTAQMAGDTAGSASGDGVLTGLEAIFGKGGSDPAKYAFEPDMNTPYDGTMDPNHGLVLGRGPLNEIDQTPKGIKSPYGDYMKDMYAPGWNQGGAGGSGDPNDAGHFVDPTVQGKPVGADPNDYRPLPPPPPPPGMDFGTPLTAAMMPPAAAQQGAAGGQYMLPDITGLPSGGQYMLPDITGTPVDGAAAPAGDPIVEAAAAAGSKEGALAVADHAEASGLFPGARAKVMAAFGWDEDGAQDFGRALMGFGSGLLQGGPDLGAALGAGFSKGADQFVASKDNRRQAGIEDHRIALADEQAANSREDMNAKRRQASLERLRGEAAAKGNRSLFYEDDSGNIRSTPDTSIPDQYGAFSGAGKDKQLMLEQWRLSKDPEERRVLEGMLGIKPDAAVDTAGA